MAKQSKQQDYWFKRRRYGYGWVPTTWQGWASIVAYLAIVLAAIFIIEDVPNNTYQAEVGIFIGIMLSATILLVVISYAKGPEPKWRWGKKDDDNPEEDF